MRAYKVIMWHVLVMNMVKKTKTLKCGVCNLLKNAIDNLKDFNKMIVCFFANLNILSLSGTS